jgi:inner membrane protein involved in colicin E2 resistance
MNGNSALAFWQTGNLWRTISYPILYIVVAIFWINLFSSPTEATLHVLSVISGGQCLLLVAMSNRTGFEIFCATMFLITIVEITSPSKVLLETPTYTPRQRVGWGIFHAWAWTSFAFAIEKGFLSVVCRL